MPSRAFAESDAFARYRATLSAWLESTTAEQQLVDAGTELCRVARANSIPPEHLLFIMHETGVRPRDVLHPEAVAARDRQYTLAIHLLMRACYHDGAAPRLVRDVDGRDWTVMAIREGDRWDPEIEMRRRDWLSCVTGDDRRYISPVPPGWDQWTDAELAGEIRKAKPDLRG